MFKTFTFSILISVLLAGCGYKPSKYYAKDQVSGSVYIDSTINVSDIDNSILLINSVREMLLKDFDVDIVDEKSKATMILKTNLNSVSHQALKINSDNGYVDIYRTTVSISVNYNKNNIVLSDYYDYTVKNSSILTDTEKKNAVKIATTKALSNIFSKIAINSFKK